MKNYLHDSITVCIFVPEKLLRYTCKDAYHNIKGKKERMSSGKSENSGRKDSIFAVGNNI